MKGRRGEHDTTSAVSCIHIDIMCFMHTYRYYRNIFTHDYRIEGRKMSRDIS